MGNVIIILLTLLDIHLKTPMDFFLCSFSFLEIIFTTVYIPRYLVIMVTKEKTISFNDCAVQLFFFLLWITVNYFLAAVSYDCYVAICNAETDEELIVVKNEYFSDPALALTLLRVYVDASQYLGQVLYIKETFWN